MKNPLTNVKEYKGDTEYKGNTHRRPEAPKPEIAVSRPPVDRGRVGGIPGRGRRWRARTSPR